MISLLHPSRGRPEKASRTMDSWWKNSGNDGLEHILSIDTDDQSRLDYAKWFDNQWSQIIINQNLSVVEATNKAAAKAEGDILVYLSDDFKCFIDWGLAIIKEFEGVTGPMLLKVDDCLQPFNVAVLTIPIMNRALYETLGYFWHPEYKSMFVDEDLYWTAKKLGALKFAPHLKFPHIHPANPNPELRGQDDEIYRRSSANWDQGKEVFKRRRGAGFPI